MSLFRPDPLRETPSPHHSRRPWLRGLVAVALAGALVATGAAVPAAAAEGDPWMDTTLSSDERADLLAEAMTFDQKLTLFTGSGSGAVAIPELGIPARREIDGASGVIAAGVPTTAFPAGQAIASSWNLELAREFGRQAGEEAHLTGFSGWAGPAADLRRSFFHGRQFATYGEDPLLGGLMPAGAIEGVNETNDTMGVYSLPKHYIGNNQETARGTMDTIIDERTLRELYTRQWEPIIEADPGAIMCAYPKINGTKACESPSLLTDTLKGELSFPGWVSSDFNACVTLQAYNAGADVCGPNFPDSATLRTAVEDGTISAERFDDMVHRVLRTYFEHGLIDNPPPGSLQNPAPSASPLPASVVQSGRDAAYRMAVDGSVLLRNENGALPLDTDELDSIAVIGEGADRYMTGFGSDIVVNPTETSTILDGITARAGAGATVEHVEGWDPVRPGDLLPGAQPIPSGVLRSADGASTGITGEWFGSPDFTGPAVTTRVDDQLNWGQGLVALLATFGYDPSPAPKLPPVATFAGAPTSTRWTGSLNPTETGTYGLGFTLLGSATLSVDGEEVLTADADELQTFSVDQVLQAGESYDIRIDYVPDAPSQCCSTGGNLGTAIRLDWTPPSAAASPQIAEAVAAAQRSDVAVVVANDYMGESLDRGTLALSQNQDLLISAVTAANPNTIVVLSTGTGVEMPWVDDVAAVFESWYPGQEQGRAVAALIFGDENFSGKLPITWPKSASQVTDELGLENPVYDVNNPNLTVEYTEGLNVGYRGFDAADLDPLFEFGYGLSYTDFEYSSVEVQDPIARAGEGDDTYQAGVARVQVRNTGAVAGTETVNLYHGALPTDSVVTPERQLLGWGQITLEPGATGTVEIPIPLYDSTHRLAYWDVESDAWVTPEGETDLFVGASSRDIRLTDTVSVTTPVVDDVAPTVLLAIDPAEPTGKAGWYRDPVTVTVSATDDVDASPSVEASIDGGDFAPVTGPIVFDADGEHSVVARATDASGNVSETVQWNGKIDRTAPTVVATEQKARYRLTLTSTDATSGVDKVQYRYQIRYQGKMRMTPWLTYRSPVLFGLPQYVKVEYRATDVAGNVSAVGTYR
ncbi:glycoside hydrolase family 3 protein [Rathayibacter sp. VKM Ac-2857]|uniref:glycoside hydrolase family 3 protein n=1 Tax=Rathayibacter sp. VKM Ac-2857 TaxID=2739020 RepID=UPI0015653B01|nr:glycoside hydrolase family 3 C-terminal domain-containing protein [Rathayibacter sp. VKM Ac-2857]NQX16609.1 glycoside hydrolase family 3 C-terminal domain-containing protein [Rathayibacter sp. VKM Ac-2857]